MKKRVLRYCLTMLFISTNTVTSYGAYNNREDVQENLGCSRSLEQPEQKERKLLLGREYYYAVIDKTSERHWALPVTAHFEVTNRYFNNSNQLVDLGQGLFGSGTGSGGGIRLRDIYLPCALAADNLISIESVQPVSPTRNGQSITPNLPFGSYADDLYLTLIANATLGFNAQQKESSFNFSAIYQTDFCGCVEVAFGGILPVGYRTHDLGLEVYGGSLFDPGFVGDTITRQNTLTEFFLNYSSLEDFVIRQVLGGKGINYVPRQVKVGFGDLSLFALVDFAQYCECTDGLQLGVNVIFPTGAPATNNTLLEPTLGEGAYTFEPFFNVLFHSPSPVFNPTLKVVGSVSLARKATGEGVRVAQNVTASVTNGRPMVGQVPDLNAPTFFNQFFVGPINGVADSAIPDFANAAYPATIKRGSRFLVGIGNYFYNVFNLGFRLGVFYDYSFKRQDLINLTCPNSASFNLCPVVNQTETRTHNIGLNLTYKFDNMLELNIGTQNVIAGRNTPRINEVFGSIIFVF